MAGQAEPRADSIGPSANPMIDIVDEIRAAYRKIGITLDQPAAFGTYYRLLCAACGRMVGNVGDKLLPGMAAAVVDEQFDLYAVGLLGCECGHQREVARELDPVRWQQSRERHPDVTEGRP